MTRSSIVGLVVAIALGAALAVIAHRESARYGVPADRALLGIGGYAAATAGFVVRRIGEPKLAAPILAWILIVPLWLIALVGSILNRDDNTDDLLPDDNPFTRAMGRGRAIAWTICFLALYAACVAIIVSRDHS